MQQWNHQESNHYLIVEIKGPNHYAIVTTSQCLNVRDYNIPHYLHQRGNHNGSGVNEWIMRLAVPIQFDVGQRFRTRLVTYILMHNL